MKAITVRLLVILLLTAVLRVGAQELIVNGSFGNPSNTFVPDVNGVMTLTAGSGTIPGWMVINASLLWGTNANVFGPTTPFGFYSLDLTGYQDSTALAGVQQAVATTPGQTYRLSFALGAYQSNPLFSGPMSVVVLAGSVTNSFTFNPTGAGSQWGTFTQDFIATNFNSLILIAGTGSGGGAYLGLDNVSVIALAPRLAMIPAAPGTATISWTPATPGFVLQETLSLAPTNWMNSISGTTNPVTVPVVPPTKFYRLIKP